MTHALTNVLLTGATGFVGTALLNRLVNDNRFYITATARDPSVILGDCVITKTIDDINGLTDWSDALKGVDCVLHVAGRAHVVDDNASDSLESFRKVNVAGTLTLARQAAEQGMRRFVFVSSIGVYGNSTSVPFSENSQLAPHAEYAQSKLEAELELQKLSQQLGFELVIVRPVLVYGANAPGNFGLFTKLVKKMPLLPFGKCDNTRSFISVDNLADFLLLCAVHPAAANQDFVISDGVDVSMKQFTDAIASGLQTSLIQLPVPVSLMRKAARLLGKDKQAGQLLDNLQVDCSKAKQLLGWQPHETMDQAMSKLNFSNFQQ